MFMKSGMSYVTNILHFQSSIPPVYLSFLKTDIFNLKIQTLQAIASSPFALLERGVCSITSGGGVYI